jgi:hypothetical protein
VAPRPARRALRGPRPPEAAYRREAQRLSPHITRELPNDSAARCVVAPASAEVRALGAEQATALMVGTEVAASRRPVARSRSRTADQGRHRQRDHCVARPLTLVRAVASRWVPGSGGDVGLHQQAGGAGWKRPASQIRPPRRRPHHHPAAPPTCRSSRSSSQPGPIPDHQDAAPSTRRLARRRPAPPRLDSRSASPSSCWLVARPAAE